MNNHAFVPQETLNPNRFSCARCGKQLHHEEHFGGDRIKAAEAYRMLRYQEDQEEPVRHHTDLQVPHFSTQEEADEWLEARNPVPQPLHFESQEEADDYLRRQAGEPYVPDRWIDLPDKWVDERFYGGAVGVLRSEPVQRVKAEGLVEKMILSQRAEAMMMLSVQSPESIVKDMGL